MRLRSGDWLEQNNQRCPHVIHDIPKHLVPSERPHCLFEAEVHRAQAWTIQTKQAAIRPVPVSYTHLDVYKRQAAHYPVKQQLRTFLRPTIRPTVGRVSNV